MNFMKFKNLFVVLFIATLLICVGLLFANPYNGWGTKEGSALNLGVDFTGGTKIYFPVSQPVSSVEAAEVLSKIDLPDFKYNPPQPNKYMDTTGVERHQILIYTRFLNDAEQEIILGALEAEFGKTDVKQGLDITRVDPLIGRELIENAIYAILISLVLMLVYITFRFEAISAVAAVLALVHDAFFVIGVFALFGLEINVTMIAAVLTVIGYSINDTIVLFDRIRENLRNKRRDMTYSEIANDSILQTFRRSFNTSLTTIGAILVFYLSVATIRDFCLAMIIGMTSGVYSTMFIAGSIWAVYKDGQEKKRTA